MNPYRVPELSSHPGRETPLLGGVEDGVGLCLVVFVLGISRVAQALWIDGSFGAEATFALLLALVSGREVALGLWTRVRPAR